MRLGEATSQCTLDTLSRFLVISSCRPCLCPSGSPLAVLTVSPPLSSHERNRLVLRDPLSLPFPVRFLQGTNDADVKMSVALRLLEHASGDDMRLTLVDGADHRFSDERCLALITSAVEEVIVASR